MELDSVAQYVFLVNSKLYVGGPTISIVNLSHYPYDKVETHKVALDPMPSQVLVLNGLSLFTGEALFSLTTFERLSLIELNVTKNITNRRLLDFCSATSSQLNLQYALATS